MGVNAEDIVVCLCTILQFSIKSSHRFVQNHPFVSVSLCFSLLVYVFLPFILSFLAYSSPFLVCIGILLRIFWTSEQSHIVKGDERRNNVLLHKKPGSVEYDHVVNRNDRSSLQNQTSVRRNVKEKNKELDLQSGKKEEDMVLQAASNEDPIGKTAIKEKESRSFEHGESSSTNKSASKDIQNLEELCALLDSERSEQTRQFDVGIIELETDNLEEADDDDEEEAQEDGNQAVEWTEDDQRNLMDLGISEIERNRRLESLIAKRRAKKLRRMQVERASIDLDSIPPSQVAPIFVARNNPIDVPNILDEIERLKMPDSAPSILLPTRNPFDIPYDPLEEKPNLMGDSFDQEFMAAHKEMLFCRHESFSLGPSFPWEIKQDRRDTKFSHLFVTEKGALEGPEHSRFQRHPNIGDHDKLVEQLSHKEGDHHISLVDNIPDLVETGTLAHNQVINSAGIEQEEDIITKNNMIDIKEEKEMERSQGMESILSKKREVDMETNLTEDSSDESNSFSSSKFSENVESNPAEMSIRSLVAEPESEPSYDSSPSANDKNRREDCNFFAGNHTPDNSIASDLEVEVSEVGSLPLTVDGTITPTDGESMTYDEEIEKEITSVSEEMWGASFHQSGVEENESKSRGIYAVHREDIVEIGLSEGNTNSKDVVVSSKHPQEVDVQESTDTSSLSSPTIDIYGESQAQSINIHHKIHADVKQVVEKVGAPKSPSSKSSNPSSTENLKREMHLMEKLVAHSLHEVYSENPEDLSYPHEMSKKGVNAVYDVNPIVHRPTADTEELKMNESTNGGWQLVNKQDTEEPIENQDLLDSAKSIEGNNNSKPIKDVGGNQVKLTEDEVIVYMPKPIEDKDNLKSIQESGDEQSIIASGAYGVNQNSNDPIASAAPQELVIEEVPINSSSSSSTKSVLAEKIPIDPAPSSNSSKNSENTAKIDTFHEQIPLNLTRNEPQNAQHMVEDTNAHATKNHGFENFLEPSSPSEKSAEETNSFDSLRETMVDEAKIVLKSIQESVDEQSIIASGVSGVSQNSDDPIASASSQELVIEEVPINSSSSSSPISILPEEIEIDRASSSNSSQNLENTAKTYTLDEQLPMNLTLTAPHNAQHMVEDTNAHPTNENVLEPSSSSEKSAEETNSVDSLREPMVNEAKINLKSIQESLDEQSIIASGASGVNQNYDDPIESALSQELVIEDVPINSSSSSSPKSVLPEEIEIDQASLSNSSQNLEKNNAKTDTLDEQLLNLTLTAPQNAQQIVEDRHARPTKDDGFENLLEPGKFTTEANTVYNVNDPVVSDMDGEEKFKSFEKSEGESQSLIKQVTVLEPPAPDEETSSEFIEDDDEKSSELTEGEALLDPSKPFDDKIENSITKEETGDSGKLNEHDTIFHLPNSAFTACNLESTENVGGEYENLRESEAVDPSKTAVGKGYLDVSANIKEEEPSNHLQVKSAPES